MNTRTIAVASAALLTFAGGAYAVAGGSAPTAITSSVTDKLGDAITAKYPGATIVGIRSESGGGYEVEVRKSDGTEVHVSVDANFKVTGTHEGGMRGMGRGMGDMGGMGGGMGHGGMGHRGPHLETAALAKAIGVSETKLTDALEQVRDSLGGKDRPQGTTPPSAADREARRKAFAEALAKELGVDADKVTKALDAQRPAGKPGDRP